MSTATDERCDTSGALVDVCRGCMEGVHGDRVVVVTLTHTVELTLSDVEAVYALARKLGTNVTTALGMVADRLGLAAREPDPVTWDDAYWRTSVGAVALVDVDAETLR